MKPTEAVRPETAPSVKAGSTDCIFGAEWFALSWIAGLLSAFLHHAAWGLAFAAAAGLVLLYLRRRGALLCMLCGISLGLAAWTAYDVLVRQPLCAMDGQTVTCTGTVMQAERLANDRARYTLSVKLRGIPANVDWYAEASAPELKTGDAVTLKAELTRIAPDYRYDTAAYQAGRGQYLRIYRAEVLRIHADKGFSLRRAVQGFRAEMTERIRCVMPQEDAGLLCAMLFGDKSMLTDNTQEALYRSGIGHITAVSGMHLVLFCMALGWLFRLLQIPAKVQFLLLLPAIAVFMLLVDSSVSVSRAACMLLIVRAAPLFGRRGDTLRALCLTVPACTLLTPYVIGSASFWLSVSGVFGIGIAAPYLLEQTGQRGLRAAMLELCAVSLSVFPASVLLCGESSLIAPFSNLMILPFASAALYIGFAVLLSGGLLGFLLPAGGVLCRMTRLLAESAAHLPYSHLTAFSDTVRAVVLISGLLLLLMLALHASPRRLAAAAAACAVLTAGVNAYVSQRRADELQIAVLGRRQESVLVISADGHTLIADLSGDVRNPQFVHRYLTDAGITQADALLCCGKTAAAYQAALGTVSVGQVILPLTGDWADTGTVCGRIPEFPGAQTAVLRAERLTCTADAQSGLLQITWGDVSVTACPAEDPAGYTADAVIRWGGAGNRTGDRCSVWLNPGGETGQNTLLRLRTNGAVSLQTLR
ncbi:MAG: ComEC/Rec2 family competence protein [Oscillospiraceae bacterium]|nr:ComEC/Rec2 family competence protein [Oscillospiraceae bacterium]